MSGLRFLTALLYHEEIRQQIHSARGCHGRFFCRPSVITSFRRRTAHTSSSPRGRSGWPGFCRRLLGTGPKRVCGAPLSCRRPWCSSRRGLHSNGRCTHPRSSPLNPRTQAQHTNLVFVCANDKPRHRTRIAAPLARGDAVPRARTQAPLPRGTAAPLPRTWTQAPLPRLGLKQRLEPNNSTN